MENLEVLLWVLLLLSACTGFILLKINEIKTILEAEG